MADPIHTAYQRAVWALVLRGLLAIFIGVFIFWRPLDSIAAFALLVAWWSLFSGTTQLVHAVQLRNVFDSWWVLLLSGIVGVAFGIAALVYYPGLSLAAIMGLIGGFAFVSGAVLLIGAFRLASAKAALSDALHEAAAR